MVQKYGPTNIGVFGYGSLLSEPGRKLASHVIDRIPCRSPWSIEYARQSKSRGDGPTLVIHKAGSIVQGQILVLDVLSDRLEEARAWLREREGWPLSECIKEMKLGDLEHVLYCDLESTLSDADLNAESLAKFAIESVRLKPERNAISYLARNIEKQIITPLTYSYRDAILRLTKSRDLDEAEQKVLSQVKDRRLRL